MNLAIPPGETINDMLEEQGMSLSEFAKKMQISEERAEYLLEGDEVITDEIARKLCEVLGADVSFWLNLEAQYREDLENDF